jgi:Histidine kinase-, DNA gyrase B-, and HSP90-like ATPase
MTKGRDRVEDNDEVGKHVRALVSPACSTTSGQCCSCDPAHGAQKFVFQIPLRSGRLMPKARSRFPKKMRVFKSRKADAVRRGRGPRDEGIRIPENGIANIFARSSHGSNVSGIVGAGVGLYLVEIVVGLHGGSVSVESVEGQGGRFISSATLAAARLRKPNPTSGLFGRGAGVLKAACRLIQRACF